MRDVVEASETSKPGKGRGVFGEVVKVNFLLHNFLHARLRGQVNLKQGYAKKNNGTGDSTTFLLPTLITLL